MPLDRVREDAADTVDGVEEEEEALAGESPCSLVIFLGRRLRNGDS